MASLSLRIALLLQHSTSIDTHKIWDALFFFFFFDVMKVTNEDDNETVAMIKELLDSRIR